MSGRALLVMFALAWLARSARAGEPIFTRLSEKILARIPAALAVPGSLTVSPDGRRIACVVRAGEVWEKQVNKWRVILDGEGGLEHDGVLEGSLLFSPDSAHFAYIARDGNQVRLVLDGKPHVACDEILPASLAFSPQGGRLAYTARKHSWRGRDFAGTVAVVVLDGKEGQPCTAVLEAKFSPDGRRFAYVAQADNYCVLVVDGATVLKCPGDPRRDYAPLGGLEFSPDGRRLAYHLVEFADGKRRDRVVVDGTAGEPFDFLVRAGGARLIFESPDVLHYLALKYSPDERSADLLLVSERLTPTRIASARGLGRLDFTTDAINSFIVSPDGRRAAWLRRSAKGWHLVVDGRPGDEWDDISAKSLTFSPDSRCVAAIARRGDKFCVVAEGTAHKAYDEVVLGSLLFGPDGRRLAYVARDRQTFFAVLDGQESRGYTYVKELTFSPDGRRFGYVARLEAREVVVVDDREVGMHDQASHLRFTPDSAHCSYVAREGPRGELVVIGDRKWRVDDAVLRAGPTAIFFGPDRKWHCLGIRYSLATEEEIVRILTPVEEGVR